MKIKPMGTKKAIPIFQGRQSHALPMVLSVHIISYHQACEGREIEIH